MSSLRTTSSESGQKDQRGFRLDYDIDEKNLLTLQADNWYMQAQAEKGAAYKQHNRIQGGNGLIRLTSTHNRQSETHYQFYYDRHQWYRLPHTRNTYDLEVQHTMPSIGSHKIIMGMTGRHTRGKNENESMYGAIIEDDEHYIISSFIQDTISLTDKLSLTLGSKFEYNNYTDLELLPSARLLYSEDDWTIWASYARGARTPSATEMGLIAAVPGISGFYVSSYEFESEYLDAYELGYRKKFNKKFSIDTTAYYNQYTNHKSLDPADGALTTNAAFISRFGPGLEVPYDNDASANAFGTEVAFNWLVNPKWRLHGSYSFAKFDMNGDPTYESEGDHPEHMVNIQSYWDITDKLQWNVMAYYTDNTPDRRVTANIRLDSTISYKISDKMDLYLHFKNLLKHRTLETSSAVLPEPFEVPRSFYIGVRFRF